MLLLWHGWILEKDAFLFSFLFVSPPVEKLLGHLSILCCMSLTGFSYSFWSVYVIDVFGQKCCWRKTALDEQMMQQFHFLDFSEIV